MIKHQTASQNSRCTTQTAKSKPQIKKMFYTKRQAVNKERKAKGLEPLRVETKARPPGPHAKRAPGSGGWVAVGWRWLRAFGVGMGTFDPSSSAHQ